MPFAWFGRGGSAPSGPVDAKKLQWAAETGIVGSQLEAFKAVARLAQNHALREDGLQQGQAFDKGQFGDIYSGTYKGARVAVKRINQDGRSIRELFVMIAPEVRATSALVHKHIVRFVGVTSNFPEPGEGPSAFCLGLVFEFCENGSLWDNIHKKRAKLPLADKFRIASETASAMEHIHARGYVHRDLNSNNILLTGSLSARVADFGCAVPAQTAGLGESFLAGTPNYMAPEQLSCGAVGPAADCWALGVVLWEALNEISPWGSFRCGDPAAMRRLVVDERARLQRTPDGKLAPGLRAPVDALLDAALEREPARRADMRAIRAALDRISGKLRRGAARAPAGAPPAEARLQARLQAFYRKHNPAKLKDAPHVARVHVGSEVQPPLSPPASRLLPAPARGSTPGRVPDSAEAGLAARE